MAADFRTAEEIENLKNESQVLRRIRNSIGSPEFAKEVFNKVFKDDVDRLRSMEDMWSNRKAPSSLDFDQVSKEANSINASVSRYDQSTWTLAENFVVFADRYNTLLPLPGGNGKLTLSSLRRLSIRSKKAQAESSGETASAILTFDKDDEDTLDFVAAAANLRSMVFGIEAKSKFDIKRKHLRAVAHRCSSHGVLRNGW